MECIVGIALVPYWLKRLATRYEITSQQTRTERGILPNVKGSIYLFRIDHSDPHLPAGVRLAGSCLLHLRSSDASVETVILYRIPSLEQFSDTLREGSHSPALRFQRIRPGTSRRTAFCSSSGRPGNCLSESSSLDLRSYVRRHKPGRRSFLRRCSYLKEFIEEGPVMHHRLAQILGAGFAPLITHRDDLC